MIEIMDAFDFNFETNSLVTDDTNSESSSLDWTAFQPTPPTGTPSPFSASWFSPQEDAVAPDDRLKTMISEQDSRNQSDIEHFFRGLHQHQTTEEEQPPHQQLHGKQELIETIYIPDQIRNDMHCMEPSHRVFVSSTVNEGPPVCLPSPLVPRLSSTRSQCYHKLPDHAVKMMQDWYNAHLEDPYPRSPDKKRFITEGNITAQQCRSWFANRRQRLKHVKRSQPRAIPSRSQRPMPTKMSDLYPIEEQQPKLYEPCYYCQQSSLAPSSPSCLSVPISPTTTTTLNVVINQQTVEQLIQNSLRKLFNPTII
ncbi:unnamed protein product [Adineta ricciae]|uniref:Homeobox domain-containing protein n=1 Tax=Adineta ricciae TaxID=249248 RepID=A0A813P806_ADIRI|nr:unnamed protein product [Adineta ricciae]